MSTLHKCDKCGKVIKGKESNMTFSDMDKRFFENGYNSYDFCEACIKPLAVYLKGFLKVNNKAKK